MHAGILQVLAAVAMALPLAVSYAPIGFGPGLSLAGPAFLPRRADVAARALSPLDAFAPRQHARAGQLQPAKPTLLRCSSSLGRALNAGGSDDRAAVGFGALQTMRPLLLGETRVSRRGRIPLKAGGEPDPEKVRTCLPASPPRAREGCVCHLRGNQLCSADPPQLRQGAGGPSSVASGRGRAELAYRRRLRDPHLDRLPPRKLLSRRLWRTTTSAPSAEQPRWAPRAPRALAPGAGAGVEPGARAHNSRGQALEKALGSAAGSKGFTPRSKADEKVPAPRAACAAAPATAAQAAVAAAGGDAALTRRGARGASACWRR